MIKYTTPSDTHKLILKVFKEINDLVVPTMGAKGRLAVLNAEFDKPTMTDDGVSVAKECRNFDGLERMIAVSMIEAAGNTEKEAFDGTTLTVLLCYELFNWGFERVRRGEHPQIVAAELEELILKTRSKLKKNERIMLDSFHEERRWMIIQDLAEVSTKIPELGECVAQAYQLAGAGMNVVLMHDRENEGLSVEHTEGMSLESGYMADVMRPFCNDESGTKSVFEGAHLVLLKDGIQTTQTIKDFFKSIPADQVSDPFVFVVDPGFNPEAMRYIIEILTQSGMIFQFIFLNEQNRADVFIDLGIVSGGKIQDITTGASEYTFADCGLVKKITVDIDKTLIEYDKKAVAKELDKRIAIYEKRISKDKFKMSAAEADAILKRIGSLTKGLVRLKIGVPTIVEFKTLALKLDDAIGAVRVACDKGFCVGGGKALYNVSLEVPKLSKVLQKPMRQILANAGVNRIPRGCKTKGSVGYDVKRNVQRDLLKENMIIDGFESVDLALKNAGSIACNYLKSYTLIMRDMSTKK